MKAVKGPLHSGIDFIWVYIYIYMCVPLTCSGPASRTNGNKKQEVARGDHRAVGRAKYGNTRKQKKRVGLFRIRDEWAKETNHSGDERID